MNLIPNETLENRNFSSIALGMIHIRSESMGTIKLNVEMVYKKKL